VAPDNRRVIVIDQFCNSLAPVSQRSLAFLFFLAKPERREIE
jgi:hypothetical protein